MKRPTKSFDCVDLKNQIQAQLYEERKSLGDVEMQKRYREWLENSEDPLASWWRSIEQSKHAYRTQPEQ